MGKTNWKKVLLFTVVAGFGPALSNWSTSFTSGTPIPFNVENIVFPAVPVIITTLAALFSNPRYTK